MKNQPLTPAKLKAQVENTGSNFFSRQSMKFFGDTMNNYYVPVNTVEIKTATGVYTCYELQRRRPVKQNLNSSAYFDAETFQRRHIEIEYLKEG